MAMSGIEIHPDVIEKFNEMKTKHIYQYLILKIKTNEKKKEVVVVDEAAEKGTPYEDFVSRCEAEKDKGEGMYCVYDCCKDGKVGKLILISWVTDSAKVKQRMIYASTKETLKNALDNIQNMHCTETTDLAWENVVDKAFGSK